MRRAAVAAERLGRFGVVVSTVQRENDTRPVQYRPVQYIRRRRQYSTEGKRPGRYSTIGVVIGTVQKEHDTRPRQADSDATRRRRGRAPRPIRRRHQYSTEGKRHQTGTVEKENQYSTEGKSAQYRRKISTVQKENQYSTEGKRLFNDTRPRQADPRLFHVGPWSCPGPLPSAAPTCTTDEGVRRAGWRSNSPWLPRPLPLHSLQAHTSCLFTPSLVLSLLVSF